MSKLPAKQVAPGKVSPNALQTINRCHREASKAAVHMAVWAAMCGLELVRAKKLAGHGNWDSFVASHCEFTARTAGRYMALGEAIKARLIKSERAGSDLPGQGESSKSDTGVSDLPNLMTVAPSELTPDQQEALFALVAQAVDGATLTALYQEYGIVKRLEGGAEGGYRPNPALVQTFLRQYHKALVGTLYADLPADVQEHFRRWVRHAENDDVQMSLDFYQVTVSRFDEFAPNRRKILDKMPAPERAHLADTLKAWLADLEATQD